MGIVRNIEKRYSAYSGGSLENPANWMVRMFGGQGTTAAGVDVNEKTALYQIDVLTCVRIISETIAQLPLITYKRLDGGGKQRATKHPLYEVLQEQANSEMTAFVLKETLQSHLLTWGNAYAWIERNADQDCIGLWPLLPDRTRPIRDAQGNLWYQTQIKKLPVPGDPGILRTFPARDVFHIPGLGFDGLVGYSVIQMIREQIGLAQAQEEFDARFYSNGSHLPTVINYPTKLGDDDFKRLQAQWDDGKKGNANAWKTALLDQGMTVQTIGIPQKDSQFIESRKFSAEKIAGFFRVPPHMVGDTEKATSYGQGIEQQQIGFTQFTIQPWAVRWEHAIDMKLMLRPRDQGYFTEFLIDGLQRGDIKTRYEAYGIGFGKWLTTDDIREKENMNPYVKPADEAIGQRLLWPVNYDTAERIASGESTRRTPNVPEPTQPSGPEGDPTAGEPDPTQQASMRRSLAKAQRIALADAADRILRRESSDILARSKKPKANWLEAFYEDHRDYIKRQFGPQLRSYAELVGAEVSRELGRDVTVPESFVTKYIDGYAQRHIAASRSEMQTLAGATTKQLEDAFLAWGTRADWIARREASQAGNAFARAVYREAGAPMVWMAGDDCPDCLLLHGRTATDGVFAQRGELSDDRFVPASGLGHPPLCEGCDCVVVADGVVRAAADPVVVRAAPPVTAPDPLTVALISKLTREQPAQSPVLHLIDREGMEQVVKEANEVKPEDIRAISEAVALAIRATTPEPPPPAPPARMPDIILRIEPGAFVTNVAPPNLTIEKGAIQAPTTISEGAVRVEMPKSKGKRAVYDAQGRVEKVEDIT